MIIAEFFQLRLDSFQPAFPEHIKFRLLLSTLRCAIPQLRLEPGSFRNECAVLTAQLMDEVAHAGPPNVLAF